MDYEVGGRLHARGGAVRWFFEPRGKVDAAGRAFLLGQMLGSPAAAVMGSFCAITVVTVAFVRSGDLTYGAFLALEVALTGLRLIDWRQRARRLQIYRDHLPSIDASILLSLLWCMLQGVISFKIMSDGDSVLRLLSATLVMAMTGPICARNYAAPRFAFLLVLLCELPFVAGALASGEPWLAVLAPMTPPFLFGAMQIIGAFHRTMLMTLAAEARNRHLAHHDSLTGILNRQGMDQALSQICPGRHRNMALLCVDLDGFKQVNDMHGHGAGDLLLVQVAGRIQEVLEDGLVARMGGDEFMTVVRNMSPEEVEPLAEKLINAISSRWYKLEDGTIARVGASIGFACLPEDAASTIELRLRADQALYAAKGAAKGVGRRYRARAEEGAEGLLAAREQATS